MVRNAYGILAVSPEGWRYLVTLLEDLQLPRHQAIDLESLGWAPHGCHHEDLVGLTSSASFLLSLCFAQPVCRAASVSGWNAVRKLVRKN